MSNSKFNLPFAAIAEKHGIIPADFTETALQVYRFQFQCNPLYGRYCKLLGRTPQTVRNLTDIPFLPVSFFKTHSILTGTGSPILTFESSGTTGDTNARHLVADPEIYNASLRSGFEACYGPASEWVFLALLPSYLERPNASLVYMVQQLMDCGNRPENGFYTNDYRSLAEVLRTLRSQGRKTMLFGVTFALLEFAELFPGDYGHITVLETGGMKGRRAEMTRDALHSVLKRSFNIEAVHSEYGMTEMLSQAYSPGEGVFYPSATMKVLVRDPNDPADVHLRGAGCLNVIDLANILSCSFLATDDLGRVETDGSFQVMGRKDNSDLRGCNLMFLPQ